MDYKKIKADNNTVTRDLNQFDYETGNIYETVAVLSKRANQISNEIKEELHKKLQEFATAQDNLEEIFENREQIEIAKFYERLPKPSLIAIHEFLCDKLYIKKPQIEEQI